MYALILKQRNDGQIRVSSIRVPKEVLDEQPFIKDQIKNNVERMLESKYIKVLKDRGVVEFE
jgi:hypothetical protein